MNKKRSFELINDENHNSNKKERLEDSSSSSIDNISQNSINYNSINNSSIDNSSSSSSISSSENDEDNIEFQVITDQDYNDFKLNELNNYALSIGLNAGRSKKEVYERIKQLLQIKENLEKEKEERDSINPFNKGRIELVVKDISVLEQLFWSTFRNKSIYKQIFSNFKYNKSFSYDRLYNVGYILERFNNGREILMDKVKNNSYMVYKSLGRLCSSFRKDTIENQSFFQQILSPSNRYLKTISRLELIKQAIENSNILVLKLLQVDKETIHQVSSIRILISKYSSIKMIDYLYNSLGYSSWVKCKNVHLAAQSNSLFTIIYQQDFSIYNESFKLKHFIKLVQILPYFYRALNQQQINTIGILVAESSILFTPKQLKSSINQLLDQYSDLLNNNNSSSSSSNTITSTSSNNNNNNNNRSTSTSTSSSNSHHQMKSSILKLIDLFISTFTKDKKRYPIPLNYYLLFKDKESIYNAILTMVEQNMSGPHSFPSYFDDIFRFTRYNNFNADILSNLIKRIKEKLFLPPPIILKSILSSSNLELVQLLFKEYTIEELIARFGNHYQIPSYIESTAVLDYLYQHYPNSILFSNYNNVCLYIKNISILKHYEQIMKRSGRQFKLNSFNPHSYFKNGQLEELLLLLDRVESNPNVYDIGNGLILRDILWFMFQDQGSTDNNKVAIKLFKSNIFKSTSLQLNQLTPIPNKEFISWLLDSTVGTFIMESANIINGRTLIGLNINDTYSNTHQESTIESSSLQPSSGLLLSFSDYSRLLYITGRYDQLFQFRFTSCFASPLSFSGHDYLPLEFIDQLLHYYLITNLDITQGDNKQVQLILKYIISYHGNLEALKLILLKYNQIFAVKSKSNTTSILEPKQIKDILRYSIKNDFYEITQLLLNHIKFKAGEYSKLLSKLKFSSIKEDIDLKNKLN